MINISDTVEQTRISLYAWLKIHKMTQEECANILGITRSHLNKVLNGMTKPSLYLLERMIQMMEE